MSAPRSYREGAFVRELLPRIGGPVEELSARLMARIRAQAVRRYQLRAFIDGYEILDRDDVVAIVRGPNIRLAGKILRLLREEAEASS